MKHRRLWLGIGAAALSVSETAMFGFSSELESMVDSWTGGTGKIYYTGGDVGTGTSTPSWQLHSLWTGTNEGAIYGQSSSTSGTAHGVQGRSAGAEGVGAYGLATHASGDVVGVQGVLANSTSGSGVSGVASASTGYAYGARGDNNSANGTGVYGTVALAGGAGVLGENTGSGTAIAMQGQVTGSTATGVVGIATSTAGSTQNKGVYGEARSELGIGVKGLAVHASGVNYGVFGQTNSSSNGYGVYSSGRFAATGTKSFQIDHPLDPEHMYLNHFCAEGPEPYLLYRGNAMLDSAGEACVFLPDYFDAINRDYTYQLTPIGLPGALYVAQEVQDGMFRIAGGLPGGKVSWTVTGVRNDAFVRANPLPAEQPKPEGQVGKYLMPELFGKGAAQGVFFQPGASVVALSGNAAQ